MAKNITKKAIVNAVSEKSNITKKETKEILENFYEFIAETLEEEAKKPLKDRKDISITNFGKFVVKNRKERMGHNPQTGDKIKIPAKTIPAFKAGKGLKEQTNVL